MAKDLTVSLTEAQEELFLPDPVLLMVFGHCSSTDLRWGISLTCRRFNGLLQQGLPSAWRHVLIDIKAELLHPRGLLAGHHPSGTVPCGGFHQPRAALGTTPPHSCRTTAVPTGPGAPVSIHQPHWRGSLPHGVAGGRQAMPSWQQHRTRPLPFLRREALLPWLSARASCVATLELRDSEARSSVVGFSGVARHDLKPEDLQRVLAMLPALTSLTLHSANDLLPDMRPLSALTRLRDLHLTHLGHTLCSHEGAASAAGLACLTGLQALSLSLEPPDDDGLGALPDPWVALTGLTSLTLRGHHRLHKLPAWITRLRRLQRVSLESNGFKQVPGRLTDLPALTTLSLQHNSLGDSGAVGTLDEWWPRSAGGLTALRELRLGDCCVLALPYGFSELRSLRTLVLSGNLLGTVPEPEPGSSHVRRSILRYLKESGDRGFDLLAHCPELERLDLACCSLEALPRQLLQLTSLVHLDLSSNPMMDLDQAQLALLLTSLPRLQRLLLMGTRAAQHHCGARHAAGFN